MALELSVYTEHSPLTANNVITAARKRRLELRFVVPFECLGIDSEAAEKPFKKKDWMVYCWPKKDTETTAVLDKAIIKGDKRAVLSVQDKMGWFEFRCEWFSYDRFWKRFPDEKKSFERSASAASKKAMKAAKVRYFLRCGLRPKQNAKYAERIGKLLADLTEGHLLD